MWLSWIAIACPDDRLLQYSRGVYATIFAVALVREICVTEDEDIATPEPRRSRASFSLYCPDRDDPTSRRCPEYYVSAPLRELEELKELPHFSAAIWNPSVLE